MSGGAEVGTVQAQFHCFIGFENAPSSSYFNGNASAVETLIPVRSSLTECIYILPDQRASRNRIPSWEDKARSICNQLAHSTVLPLTIDNLVTDLEGLNVILKYSGRINPIARSFWA